MRLPKPRQLVCSILLLLTMRAVRADEPTHPLPSIGLTRISTQRVPNNALQTYPLGKILVAEHPAAPGRYVLVPVIVTNCWDSIPLYTFHFGVQYDYHVMQAISVEKTGPGESCTQQTCLANDFTLVFSDAPDASGPGMTPHRITIDGSSSTPLPLTTPPGNDCRQSDTVDLLYIKFLVTAHYADAPHATLMRVPNDDPSLSWGQYSNHSLFPVSSAMNPSIGLAGPDEIDATGSVSFGGDEIDGHGAGNLVVTKQPGIDLSFSDADVIKLDDYSYTLHNMMHADPGSTNPTGQMLDIIDSVADTRMPCVTAHSDSPWLTIGNNPIAGTADYTLSPNLDYTSNPLLRSQSLYIIADNNYFMDNGDPPGIYTGVITFSSDDAGNSPTTLEVKFISQASAITGTIYSDDDNSGTQNAGEPGLEGVVGEALPTSGDPIAFTSGADGTFTAPVPPGTYTVAIPYPPLYRTVSPSSYSVTIPALQPGISTGNDFGLYALPGHHDLRVTMTAAQAPRPGYEAPCFIDVTNVGTTTENAAVTFAHDANVTLASASCIPPFDSYDATTLTATWNAVPLAPGEHRSIVVRPMVATSVAVGTVLSLAASTSLPTGEETPSDNTAANFPIVVDSHDPNDKQVFPDSDLSPATVAAGPWLDYTIRFQNTGTADAINIVLRDTMSAKVIAASVQTLSSSHQCTMNVSAAGAVYWDFPAIHLPAATTNEPQSHGFVTYRVKPTTSLALADTIFNTASIYFDFNPAVVTNTTVTAIAEKLLPTKSDTLRTITHVFGDAHLIGRAFTLENQKIPFSPMGDVDIRFVNAPPLAPVGADLTIDSIARPWDSPFIHVHASPAAIRAIAFNLGLPDSANWTGNVVVVAHHLDGDSSISTYGPWEVSAAVHERGGIVDGFGLLGVEPTPTTGDAAVHFTIGARSHATLDLVTTAGGIIAPVEDGVLESGPHVLRIRTRALSAGTYWVRLRTLRGTFSAPLVIAH